MIVLEEWPESTPLSGQSKCLTPSQRRGGPPQRPPRQPHAAPAADRLRCRSWCRTVNQPACAPHMCSLSHGCAQALTSPALYPPLGVCQTLESGSISAQLLCNGTRKKIRQVLDPGVKPYCLPACRCPSVVCCRGLNKDKASNTINSDLLQVYPGQRAICNPHILLRLLQCLFALPFWLLRGPERKAQALLRAVQ